MAIMKKPRTAVKIRKIKKGDMVKVIAGKDKDKEGRVIAINRKTGRILVEGINMLTKHTKPSMTNQQGGIVHQEGPIDVSNVMYLHKGNRPVSALSLRTGKKCVTQNPQGK